MISKYQSLKKLSRNPAEDIGDRLKVQQPYENRRNSKKTQEEETYRSTKLIFYYS